MKRKDSVRVSRTEVILPTYLPALPDKNPMFLEKRVYQGSSGRVYPLPFTDRIAEKPVERRWKAIYIENEFLQVLVLPEIGGRIHRILDKSNGYDLLYHQAVIKPALVGLAGPWISGGIELNWPQHHRPATFLPVDVAIDRESDGSVTVWCSDHDPLCRMKGMHGVCLHPNRAIVELKVRAYNRTSTTQTFLWWANVATRVHEAYESFFPPDVHAVADHARRSTSEYPLAKGIYYGVNYGSRADKGVPASEVPPKFVPPHCTAAATSEKSTPQYRPNNLAFYSNIPVPTSYMCLGSDADFFGGYDHKARAGIVHVANHHIAPGKKQWTWGNHEFGYAWDRNLTDPDATEVCHPYIELMAGVFTDNQPDFSFLQPGETKTWSQYWYPIQAIGPAQHANLDAAVSLRRIDDRKLGTIQLGVAVTRRISKAKILLSQRGKIIGQFTRDIAPDSPLVANVSLASAGPDDELQFRVTDSAGNEIIAYRPQRATPGKLPPPASEPPAPAEIASADTLYLTGLHLSQYRHATRCPTLYWREALRRDPLDWRCNNAMGLWHMKRGEFNVGETFFCNAINRLTSRNANPNDGEVFYNLGLCLRHQAAELDAAGQSAANVQGLIERAYGAFYKATWNQAWVSPACHALAEIDCLRRDWTAALQHVDQSLRFNTDNLRARNLKSMVLRKLGRDAEAARLIQTTLRLDPLDWWARHLAGKAIECDLQTQLDIAHDYARAGFYDEAISLLNTAAKRNPSHLLESTSSKRTSNRPALPNQSWGALPLVYYTLGWLEEKRARNQSSPRAVKHYRSAAIVAPDYCFPSRLEEIAILTSAIRANPADARAPYYLGNLLYDLRRHIEAINLWERSSRLDPSCSIVWRNLGIGYFNVHRRQQKAIAAYENAFRANPSDARLLYERDQLWKRLGKLPSSRLRELEKYPELVRQRDDLSVELCALYNQTAQPAKALELVRARKFQPWEGGEGGPLGQWVRSHLALGRAALQNARNAISNASKDSQRQGPKPESTRAARFMRCIETAVSHFESALEAPLNLGEGRHLLANQSDVHYWLGCALAEAGDPARARQHWRAAATFKGDFQEMRVRAFSEMTFYSARAWDELGHRTKAQRLMRQLLHFAKELAKSHAAIDYFATSLPTMLLFDDDLQFRQENTALFLQAQARFALKQVSQSKALLKSVLKRDPNHALAADFYRLIST